MFPGALAAAAHHQQVAVAEVVAERGTAAAWPQQQRPRGAERHNGHDRVLRPAAARRVPMPGDAVPAVPVQAQPCRAQRLAEPGTVVHVERVPGLGQCRVGKRLTLAVEAQQARDVHHPVIHLPPFGPPRHGVQQPAKQRVGPGQPARPNIHPGAAGKVSPAHRLPQRAGPSLAHQVEQRALEHTTCHGMSIERARTGIRGWPPVAAK